MSTALSWIQKEEADIAFERNRHLPSVRLFAQLLQFSSLLSSTRAWKQEALLQADRSTAFAKLLARWSWLESVDIFYQTIPPLQNTGRITLSKTICSYTYSTPIHWESSHPGIMCTETPQKYQTHHSSNQHLYTASNSPTPEMYIALITVCLLMWSKAK